MRWVAPLWVVLAACDAPPNLTPSPMDAAPMAPIDAQPSPDFEPPDVSRPDASPDAAPDAALFDLGSPDATAPPTCAADVPVVPVRRLSPLRFRETVRALLALPDAEPDLAPDPAPAISLLGTEKLAAAARELAQAFDPAAIFSCDPAELGETACTLAFIETFATRAFRRPLAPEELDGLLAAHDHLPAEAEYTDRLRLLVEILLQSPPFLYLLEVGEGDDDLRALDDHELATRLAYGFLDAPPDAELTALADAGRLRDPLEITRQTERLLADPRSLAKVRAFFTHWLELDRLDGIFKSPATWPQFTPELRTAMRRETEALFARAAVGTVRDLLVGTDALVDGPLATLYGLPPPGEPTWVALDPAQRAGVLTRAAFLSLRSGPDVQSPVHRGVFIRRKLLCLPMPPPPATVNDVPIVRGAQGDDGHPRTLREIVDARTAGPDCQSCHALINPIGFTLENFNAIGGFQTEETGYDRHRRQPYTVPVDARGSVPESDLAGEIEGGVQLSRALAESEQVADCFADQWFTWFFDRPPEPEDACSIDTLRRVFRESGGDFRVLVRATPTLPAFRYLRVAP